MEYLQQLQDKVLAEEATLLESTEGFQVAGSKHKEVISGDKKEQKLSKKIEGRQQGKYHSGTTVKMGGANPCKRCVSTKQNCLLYHSR